MVTLPLGVVGGDTFQSYTPLSVALFISSLTSGEFTYQALRFLEELVGKLPIVHIDDVCEAHIFCMEQPSIRGRFLCANSYVSSSEIADYYRKNYPEYHVKQEWESNYPFLRHQNYVIVSSNRELKLCFQVLERSKERNQVGHHKANWEGFCVQIWYQDDIRWLHQVC